jgi:hypothetical protein
VTQYWASFSLKPVRYGPDTTNPAETLPHLLAFFSCPVCATCHSPVHSNTALIVDMSSHNFGAFIQHESSPMKTGPELARVLHHDSISSAKPSTVELDALRWGERLNGPVSQNSDAITPSPSALEQSLPPTPHQDRAVGAIVQSATNPPRNRWRLASSGLMFLLIGINDAVVCPMISIRWHASF